MPSNWAARFSHWQWNEAMDVTLFIAGVAVCTDTFHFNISSYMCNKHWEKQAPLDPNCNMYLAPHHAKFTINLVLWFLSLWLTLVLQDVIVKSIFLAFWLISCMWDVTVGHSVMSQPEWRTIFPCLSVDVLEDVDIIVVWCPAAEDVIVKTFSYIPGQPEWCGDHILGFWLMSCKRSMSGLSVVSQPEWCGGKTFPCFFDVLQDVTARFSVMLLAPNPSGGPHFLAWGWCS